MPARARERLSLQWEAHPRSPGSNTLSQHVPGSQPAEALGRLHRESSKRRLEAWWGRAPTGPECCSKSAGCPPGSGRAQRALRPPPGSSWGSAPLSAPRPLQPPAQEGGLRLVATRNPRPFPRQGALPTPPPHQTFQLPKGEGEEVDLDDAAKGHTSDTCSPCSPARWWHFRGWAQGQHGEPRPHLWKRLA